MPMPDYRIRGVPQLQQQQGPLGALGEFAKGEALSRGLDAAFPGAGLAKDAATAVLPSFFYGGGGVMKPMYQRMGGMTPGPLGMSDMLAAGKGKDVSKVLYKKKGGDIEDQVEISYHAPLAAKPSGE